MVSPSPLVHHSHANETTKTWERTSDPRKGATRTYPSFWCSPRWDDKKARRARGAMKARRGKGREDRRAKRRDESKTHQNMGFTRVLIEGLARNPSLWASNKKTSKQASETRTHQVCVDMRDFAGLTLFQANTSVMDRVVCNHPD
jgi:hypothetical protein